VAEHRYVYAILGRGMSVPQGLAGMAGSPVKPVQYRQLSAATSLVDPAELRLSTEEVLLHESIVETLRQSGHVLPVRFGTVLASRQAVEDALRDRYDTLVSDLDRLGDKIELGLTVLWADPSIAGEEEQVHDRGASHGSHLTGGPGTQYLQARRDEYRQEMALREKAEVLAQSLDAMLSRFAVDHRRTILPSPRIAIRAAYLLQPSDIDTFQEAFEKARAQYRELRFLLSGPWPPYNFVTATGTNDRSTTASDLEDLSAEIPAAASNDKTGSTGIGR
jgi:Gas vesicle synthesis protein GvpL/GvpF